MRVLLQVEELPLVELVEVDLDPVHGQLAVDVHRTGERPERAHPYLGRGDAWRLGPLRLRLGRRDGGDLVPEGAHHHARRRGDRLFE